ncbi:uncharacterized protein PAC_11445 [Phialocephala subalpina]|uniref:WSC domain-containing protein n=1 Tax=Phialocephala subalpina TaxID=576137 RepID=A0A1L7X935_9HELO|nr:uncharacterized protein PAC_11445 [Phialocephala subalpina]
MQAVNEEMCQGVQPGGKFVHWRDRLPQKKGGGFSRSRFQVRDPTPGVTEWLPISTAWPARPECSTQVYGANGGSIIAFDPYYASISSTTAIPCLPTEFRASWTQAYATTPAATTLMGPTFVCPAAYASVGELLVQFMQMLLCCPSEFHLATPITTLINPTGFFPSQYCLCVAYERIQRRHSFEFPDYFRGNTSTSTSTGSTNTATVTGNSASSSKGLSNGAYAGIGVGAAFLPVAMLTAGILLWRRWKRKREYNLAGTEGGPTREGGYSGGGMYGGGHHEMGTPDVVKILGRHEMDDMKSHIPAAVHEMYADHLNLGREIAPHARQELSALCCYPPTLTPETLTIVPKNSK